MSARRCGGGPRRRARTQVGRGEGSSLNVDVQLWGAALILARNVVHRVELALLWHAARAKGGAVEVLEDVRGRLNYPGSSEAVDRLVACVGRARPGCSPVDGAASEEEGGQLRSGPWRGRLEVARAAGGRGRVRTSYRHFIPEKKP